MTLITGKEALIQILRQEGVKYVFGIPGATEVVFMDALEDVADIQFILGLHETTAAGMAEGYSRASGKPGVLNLHTLAGLSAALPLLSNSCLGGVPLIVTAGQQDTRLAAQEPAMGADLVRIARPYVKWANEIHNVEDIPLVMRRAFRVALTPPQGPVFISIPQNILDQTLDYEYQKGVRLFTQLHPDPEAIRLAADLISRANNPVMLVEDGVTKNGALAEVTALAELTGARVYQQWMSDVNFPVNHPLYGGDLDVNSLSTREMLEKTDLIIVIGAAFFSQAIYTPKPILPPHVKVIQIDDNPWQIGKNYPVDAGIQGSIKAAVADLTEALKAVLTPKRLEAAAARRQAASEEKQKAEEAFRQKASSERNNVPISPSRLMQEIRDTLEPGTRIVDDCWSYSAILRRTLGFSEAGSYQRARGGGSIGYGLPGALGVKLASPDRPVVCISGDGSAMWSIQSLWTAAHYNIPVTYIICANSIYRQVRIMKDRIMGKQTEGRYLGTDISNPRIDFCGIARSLGIPGIRVDRPEELGGVLKSAFSSGKLNLVEVTVDGSLDNK